MNLERYPTSNCNQDDYKYMGSLPSVYHLPLLFQDCCSNENEVYSVFLAFVLNGKVLHKKRRVVNVIMFRIFFA